MLLVEIQPGLMSAQEIDFELDTFDFDRDLGWSSRRTPLRSANPSALRTGASFRSTITMSPKKIDHCGRDQILSYVHRQCERLQDEIVAVTIDDQARKTVAFAPHHAAQLCIDVSPVPVFGRLLDAAPEKILIKILPSPRKTARNNLRFRIVNRATDQNDLCRP